jgi:GTPase SAR1 family protein
MAASFAKDLGTDEYNPTLEAKFMCIGVSQEKTVVFVGEKLSGKSSLIAKFLDDPVKDDMKETTALDFRYGTRTKDDKKQKVNIYELGKSYCYLFSY